MARTANPDKPKIDALRAEGKLHVQAIKDGHKASKKLVSVNAKLAKFDVAEIVAPEAGSMPAAKPAKAKTPAKAATKAVAAKKATKVEAPAKAPLAKGTKGKAAAKSVTTAPKKGRGRPKATDSDLDFD